MKIDKIDRIDRLTINVSVVNNTQKKVLAESGCINNGRK